MTMTKTVTDRYYRPPTWVRTRLVNPLLRALVLRAGLGRRGDQNLMRVLRVRGRRSGRSYDVPVRIAAWNGQRYILSLLGESQWARNLRAAGTAQLLVGTNMSQSLPAGSKPRRRQPSLPGYCQQPENRLSFAMDSRPTPRT